MYSILKPRVVLPKPAGADTRVSFVPQAAVEQRSELRPGDQRMRGVWHEEFRRQELVRDQCRLGHG